MKCPKCSSEVIELKQDSRGIPTAYCAECESYIKKMSTGEVIDYYKEQLAIAERALNNPEAPRRTVPCRFCNEKYFYREGRLGTIYKPVEVAYCPRCGRKKQPDDLKY